MCPLKLFKKHKILSRIQEEALYAFVMQQIDTEPQRTGLYALALVEAEGDEKKVYAAYIRRRVQATKDAFTIDEIIAEEYKKAKVEEDGFAQPGVSQAEEYRGYQYVKRGGQLIITGQPPSDSSKNVCGLEFSNFDQLKFFVDKRCDD